MKNSRKKNLRIFQENLIEYTQQTTIHGTKYLYNPARPYGERIFWIIIFIVSISLFGYFVNKIVPIWMNNEIIIVEQSRSTPVFEIPFPAVTICPQIKIKRDKLKFVAGSRLAARNEPPLSQSTFEKQLVMGSQICSRTYSKYWNSKLGLDITRNISLHLPSDWIETLHDMSPSLDDVFVQCEYWTWELGWRTPSKENCRELFSTVITNEGVCFTFNAIQDVVRLDTLHNDFEYHNITREHDGWDPEKGYTKAYAYPFKGIVDGAPFSPGGLKIKLKSNKLDKKEYCYPKNVGYKIELHSPVAYPQTYDNHIQLDDGKEYKIEVIPKMIETSENLRTFPSEERQCYFNDERKLKFYTFYIEQNCHLECYANYTRRTHGVPFSSPRGSNTSNRVLLYNNWGWGLPQIMNHFKDHYTIYDVPGNTYSQFKSKCNCLPECNLTRYDHKIVKSNDALSKEYLVQHNMENNRKDVTKRIKNEKKYEIEDEKNTLYTEIEIIFKEPNFIGRERVTRYTRTFATILSDFGGLLGLFMGGSILSLFELFYFLIIRNWFQWREVDEQNRVKI